jgi:hypothetical protein
MSRRSEDSTKIRTYGAIAPRRLSEEGLSPNQSLSRTPTI